MVSHGLSKWARLEALHLLMLQSNTNNSLKASEQTPHRLDSNHCALLVCFLFEFSRVFWAVRCRSCVKSLQNLRPDHSSHVVVKDLTDLGSGEFGMQIWAS